MIGTVGFASSCFCRFACVDVNKLTHNMGGDAAAAHEGVLAFAEAFVQARPSGKQNTFAAHSLPALVLVVAREAGQPVSLANAFEVPVRPHEATSLSAGAIQALSRHYQQLTGMYGLRGTAAFVAAEGGTELAAAGAQPQASVPALLAFLRDTLTAVPA